MSETRTDNCPIHGEYQSSKLLIGRWTSCKDCTEDSRQRRAREEAEAVRQYAIDECRQNCGLTGRFLKATFDSFDAEDGRQLEVLRACREYAETCAFDVWRPLWLVGGVGTGKTHLQAAIVGHIISERLAPARCLTARQIIKQLRATWAKDSPQSEEAVLRDLIWVPVLAIDELGVGFGSDSELTQLLDVIDGRYARGRPTVLASNLNAVALKAALGDRIFDRLREGATVLACDWPSYRGRLGSAEQAVRKQ